MRTLSQDGVLAERGAAHKVVQLGPVGEREARRAIRHLAGALCAADARAQVSLRRAAEEAVRLVALRRVARDDVVARHDGGDALADNLSAFDNDASHRGVLCGAAFLARRQFQCARHICVVIRQHYLVLAAALWRVSYPDTSRI